MIMYKYHVTPSKNNCILGCMSHPVNVLDEPRFYQNSLFWLMWALKFHSWTQKSLMKRHGLIWNHTPFTLHYIGTFPDFNVIPKRCFWTGFDCDQMQISIWFWTLPLNIRVKINTNQIDVGASQTSPPPRWIMNIKHSLVGLQVTPKRYNITVIAYIQWPVLWYSCKCTWVYLSISLKTHLQSELSVTLPMWKSYSLVRIRMTCEGKNQELLSSIRFVSQQAY